MYFLGVDGGGTKTVAVLTNAAGSTLKTFRFGSGNIAALDRGSIAELIRDIFSGVLAGKKPAQIRYATLAFAGAGRSDEKEVVKNLISKLGIRNFSVMTDAEIHYYSIFGDEDGILVHAGTGSFCLTRNSDGHFRQIGGLGFLLGDEGSGYDIGKRAIRFAIHEAEMQKSYSELTRELLDFYDLQNPFQFISIIYSSRNPNKLIASSAKMICELAAAGEPHAKKIIITAAQLLVKLATETIKYNKPDQSYSVALAGGVLGKNAIVNELFKQIAAERGYKFQYQRPGLPPAAAAIVYGMKKCGVAITPELQEKLEKITHPKLR